MEVTRALESTGLLNKILPPLLEDAGLEDCSLPPDSIGEAFLKAASAVKSRTATLFHSDEEVKVEPACVNDPFPDNGKCSSDILASPPCPGMSDVMDIGRPSGPGSGSVEGCVKEKGVGREVVEGKDTVVVGGDVGEALDRKGCLDDELGGLKIGKKEKKKNENQEDERGKEKPILVEGFAEAPGTL